MVFGEGGAFWLDQARAVIRRADPDLLVEWAVIIERTSKQACDDSRGARVMFRGFVDEAGGFTLDVAASDADAMLCLLNAIQGSRGLMPWGAQAILRRADGGPCG
jgi:hypothetical protein